MRMETRVVGSASHRSPTGYRLGVVLSCLLLHSAAARAADGTWRVNANGNWSATGNWTGGVPGQAGDAATFGSVITGSRTVTVDGPRTVGRLAFDDNNSYRIGGTATLTLAATGGGDAAILVTNANGDGAHTVAAPLALASNLLVTNNSAGAFTLESPLSGGGQLRTAGPSSVVLSGDNAAWAGGIVVGAGTPRLGYFAPAPDAGAYRALGAGAVTVLAGATLDLDRAAQVGNFTGAVANDLTVSGAGAAGAGAMRIASVNGTVLSGQLTLAGGATVRIDAVSSPTTAALSLGDPVTGAGGLGGTGVLVLAGNPASAAASGSVQLNVRAAHAGGTTVDRLTLQVSSLGSLVGTGTVTVNALGGLRVSRPAGDDPAAASVSPGAVKLNGGALVLGADLDAAPFLSPTTTGGSVLIDGGTYTAGGSNVLDFAALPAGSTLRVGVLNDAAIAAGVSLRPDAATRTLRFGGPGTLAVSPVVADDGGAPTHVDLNGGVITFSGANTYTGRTTVRAGVCKSATIRLWAPARGRRGTAPRSAPAGSCRSVPTSRSRASDCA